MVGGRRWRLGTVCASGALCCFTATRSTRTLGVMKRIVPTSVLSLLLIGVVSQDALGQPQDGLSSPSQEIRDATAGVVRLTFSPTARTKWEPTLEAIRKFVTRESVINSLQELGATPYFMTSSGQTSNESFRLDNEWVLTCHFHRTNTGAILFRSAELQESMQNVWVAPPSGFTGTWRTYFINGRVSHEIEYAAGAYSGVLTTFRSDGSRAVVQHYRHGVAHGDDTGYFPSSAVMYRGRYEHGVRVGTWVHYNEDGTVRHREEQATGAS